MIGLAFRQIYGKVYFLPYIQTMSLYISVILNQKLDKVYFLPYIQTMSLYNETKINKLLKDWPVGAVYLSSWLNKDDVSTQLLDRYKKSNWLSSIGTGAVIRQGDKVDYYGAIYALQKQAGLSIHVGGRSALSLQGKGQYIDMSSSRVVLVGGSREKLPAWFKKYEWGVKLDYFATSFLPADIGLVDFEMPNFSVKISSPARAMMECLYLAPKHQEFYECYELMEGLNTLRPKSVQELLESCSSVKVKRLFLYMAEKCEHDWLEYLDLTKVGLGSGKRSLLENGVYISKYQITVPRELEKNDKPEL